MHYQKSLLTLLPLLAFTKANPEPQLAQGGGLPPNTLAASQYPTISQVPSLITQGGTTTVAQIALTQTFATTALGTWDLGVTPAVGTIGLGDLEGRVGELKSRRR